MVGYDIARICLNGHLIGFDFVLPYRPGLNQAGDPFCEKCGQPTLVACPGCGTETRRRESGLSYRIPSFCRDCGKPYPWTERKLQAAKELIESAEKLDDAEKATLTADLPDLVRDTPRTQVAATRFKKLAAKVGGGIASALRDIVVDVASEAAKKIILGP